jgi:GT2 family glycosyltransferase
VSPPEPLPVYLVHWDAPEWCGSAATSILASEGLTIDLTVIDNGQRSGPPLRDCLPAGVRIISSGVNAGYTGGANLAVDDWRTRHPNGQLCVVGSHDLHVEPKTLHRLVDVAEREHRAGVVAPVLTAPSPSSGGVWLGTRASQVGIPEHSADVIEREWASGTCLMLRRACVEQVGAFDERLGSYVEDVDFGLRARDHGWTVLVVPTARVHGLGSSSDRWIAAIAGNSVLLAAKRAGVRGAVRSFALFAFWAARGAAMSVAPWRSSSRRAESRLYARQRIYGLARVLSLRTLVDVIRHPDVPPLTDGASGAIVSL